MPAQLSVNLNAVAMLRNRRDLPWPSVTGLGRIALANGAHGLTVHPRPDQRHIRFSDLPEFRALIDDEFARKRSSTSKAIRPRSFSTSSRPISPNR
jgi:pyridoxine 5-phosphate synthase